jgi:hypothetical protein
MKETFTLGKDIKLSLDKLSNEDSGKLFKMIIDFANGIEVKPDNLTLDLVFTPIKNQISLEFEKKKSKSIKMKEIGSLGGKAKAKNLPKATKSYQKVAKGSKSYKSWTVEDFKKDITENKGEYTSEMLRAFYTHWTEKNTTGKMRFQLEKTWETKLRLRKWSSNNFNKIQTTKSSNNNYNKDSVVNLPLWNK